MSSDPVLATVETTQSAGSGCDLICTDPTTRRLAELAKRVAGTDATVMITGESGTGKEVFARYIHAHSRRRLNPFVAVNCAAIPSSMLEATLFGHERGAFTGAYQMSPGKFERAQGGTLLLDEITEMDLGLQAKLLRVLQEREIERLGARKTIPLDVRVLATSNRNLEREVAEQRFRKDLYYRLNVFPLSLPRLAERPKDIIPLAQYQIRRHSRNGAGSRVLTPAAKTKLLQHLWPGNVRELDNVIQRALILVNGVEIDADHICLQVEATPPTWDAAMTEAEARAAGQLDNDLKRRERELIVEALRVENGNRQAAARRLGISPRTLRYKLARLRALGLGVQIHFGLENA